MSSLNNQNLRRSKRLANKGTTEPPKEPSLYERIRAITEDVEAISETVKNLTETVNDMYYSQDITSILALVELQNVFASHSPVDTDGELWAKISRWVPLKEPVKLAAFKSRVNKICSDHNINLAQFGWAEKPTAPAKIATSEDGLATATGGSRTYVPPHRRNKASDEQRAEFYDCLCATLKRAVVIKKYEGMFIY